MWHIITNKKNVALTLPRQQKDIFPGSHNYEIRLVSTFQHREKHISMLFSMLKC